MNVADLKRHVSGDRPYADRISTALARDLHNRYETRGDYWPVIDAIDDLEGVGHRSNAKSAEAFTHAPLNRFWHRHVAAPRHILRNISERWALASGGNRDLTRAIAVIAKEHGDDQEAYSRVLADRVVDGYRQRAEAYRLTGDWLIFGKHESRNFYLLVIPHPSGKHDDRSLYERLLDECRTEFPFLF